MRCSDRGGATLPLPLQGPTENEQRWLEPKIETEAFYTMHNQTAARGHSGGTQGVQSNDMDHIAGIAMSLGAIL
jgi:hypothetical protein